MIDIPYQRSKPYTFKDLECSLDLKIKQNESLLESIKQQNKQLASLRYDVKKLKDEVLKEKVLRLIPTTQEVEGIMTADESLEDYFKSSHTTLEDDGYFIGFKHEESRNIIVFMYQDGKHSTKRRMYKRVMKYCLELDKPIFYCSESNPFKGNSVLISQNYYQLML